MHQFNLLFKVLFRRKFFTAVNLFGISFTLMVLMVAATLMENFFFPKGPEKDSGTILQVHRLMMANAEGTSNWTSDAGYYFLDNYVRKMKEPEKVAFVSNPGTVMNYQTGSKLALDLRSCDGNLWQILHYNFLEGRPFTQTENTDGKQLVVLTENAAQKVFGTISCLGEQLELSGRLFEVIGVVENVSRLESQAYSDIWIPIHAQKDQGFKEAMVGDYLALLKAKSRSDYPKIKEEFTSLLKDVHFPDPDFAVLKGGIDTKIEAVARGFNQSYEPQVNVAPFLGLMLGITLLFMTLPALNLMNLNTSRMIERSSEIGVRKAFGAQTRDILKQFLLENLSLTFIGGILGLIFAVLVLNLVATSGFFPFFTWTLNLRVFLAGLVLITIFGLYSGIYPAWKMARLEVVDSLRSKAV